MNWFQKAYASCETNNKSWLKISGTQQGKWGEKIRGENAAVAVETRDVNIKKSSPNILSNHQHPAPLLHHANLT